MEDFYLFNWVTPGIRTLSKRELARFRLKGNKLLRGYSLVFNPRILTMRIGKGCLQYNPEFVLRLEEKQLTFVIVHEILHVDLDHHKLDFPDKELLSYAKDLEVNEKISIIPGQCEPPINRNGGKLGVFIDDFETCPQFRGIERGQSAAWYYNFLNRACKGRFREVLRNLGWTLDSF